MNKPPAAVETGKAGAGVLDTSAFEKIQLSFGEIEYSLTRKKVKNINLRINSKGEISVSAPKRVAKREIESFLLTRQNWIGKNLERMKGIKELAPNPYSKEECFAVFTAVSDSIYPLFQDVLMGEKPKIKVRDMKSRWGVCKPKSKELTFNTRLLQKPRAALEYVVMHEYVHFIYPDHQAGFHREMQRLMPDYKERRKLLREG